MAFGKRKNSEAADEKVVEQAAAAEPAAEDQAEDWADDDQGPFDIEDFDDPAVAVQGRLDLGSVLIPMPDGGQVQVELNEAGAP
nr:DUF3710 domain-containing protein [Streptomyces sp. DSM 41633]